MCVLHAGKLSVELLSMSDISGLDANRGPMAPGQ